MAISHKELLENIEAYLEENRGHYTAGDRELAALLKQGKTHLSRLMGVSNSSDSPGAKAAVNAIQANKRETAITPEDAGKTEARGIENQPKTYEEARGMFDEAHKKFMTQVSGGDNG